MTPAPEVKIMRTPDGETVEVMKVGDKWVERVEGSQHASAPIVDGRRDISATVNAALPPATPEEEYAAGAEQPEEPDYAGYLSDLGRGLAQGFTFSRGDEAVADLVSRLGPDTPRAAGRGLHAPLMTDEQANQAAYEEYLASTRADDAAAQERSPWLYGAGKAAGMAPATIALTSAGVTPLAAGAISTALDFSGEDVDAPAEERLERAGEGAVIGYAGGRAGELAGQAAAAGGRALASGAGKAADWLQRQGWRNRAAASGVYGGELARMVRQRGTDLPERIGETIERYGAHKRPGSPLLRWLPQSPGVYADTLETATGQAGARMGGAIDEATAAGAAIPARDVALGIRGAQADALAANTPGADAVAANLDDIAERLAAARAGREGGTYTPRELWDKRHGWKEMADLDNARNVMPEVNAQGAAYRQARDVLGEQIEGALGDAAPAYRQANEDYGLLRLGLNASRQRQAQELGNQIASINSPTAGTAGAVLAGAPGAAMAIGGGEALKRVGRDAMADVLSGTASMARGAQRAGSFAAELGEDVATAAPYARVGPQLADDIDFGLTPAYASDDAQEPGDGGARVAALLEQQPEALGEFAQELQEAQQRGKSDYAATLLRLQSDPNFVRQMAQTRQGAE